MVSWCASEGVAIVPQGGNTGLVGGGVPLAGEVVVSLARPRRRRRRRRRRRPADRRSRRDARRRSRPQRAPRAGPTASTSRPRDSATIGGTVATNAGGLRVLRYGDTRAQVLGVEAVLGDGSVVEHLGGLVKDNTGYDLAGAALRQRGHARRRHRAPGCGWSPRRASGSSPSSACRRCRRRRPGRRTCGAASPTSRPPSCSSTDGCRSAGRRSAAAARAAAHAVYLLVECGRPRTIRPTRWPAPSATCRRARGRGRPTPGRRAELWRYREAHHRGRSTRSARRIKLDVTLPAARAGGVRRRGAGGRAAAAPGASGCSATSPTATCT